MEPVRAFAPAKINLTLHVTGQRADGYHLLDSLVVFANVGDWVTVAHAARLELVVTGPFAADVPCDGANLVLKAAELLGAPRVAITLHKTLPAASGIGGGSSDAAATLRALADLQGASLPEGASALGADVPVCLIARPTRMSGIGDRLQPVSDLPPLHFLLVNPGVTVPTAQVFAALTDKRGAPMPDDLPRWRDAAEMALWLGAQRNDLEAPARQLAPAIGAVLGLLRGAEGCLLARMSGSGATCFALFATRTEAELAAADLSAQNPDWWIEPASTWQGP